MIVTVYPHGFYYPECKELFYFAALRQVELRVNQRSGSVPTFIPYANGTVDPLFDKLDVVACAAHRSGECLYRRMYRSSVVDRADFMKAMRYAAVLLGSARSGAPPKQPPPPPAGIIMRSD